MRQLDRIDKQVASELSISETTATVHRRRMMRKIGASTLAELVTMPTRLRDATAGK